MNEMTKISNEELIDPLFSVNNMKSDPASPAVMYFMDTDFILNKEIMSMVVEKYPLLNPNFLYSDYDIVSKIGDNSFKLSPEVMEEVRKVFEDAEFLCLICEEFDCVFSDIMNSFFSYFGDILFKRMYFYKWLFKTMATYTSEQRSRMGILERIQELLSSMEDKEEVEDGEEGRAGTNSGKNS